MTEKLMCATCWAEDPPTQTVKVMARTGARKRLCGNCMITEGAAVSFAEVRQIMALARGNKECWDCQGTGVRPDPETGELEETSCPECGGKGVLGSL